MGAESTSGARAGGSEPIRVLLTGSTGYLGRALGARLAGQRGRVQLLAGRLELTDRRAVSAAIAELRPAAVIHAAASNPGPGHDPGAQRFRAVNVEGTVALADAVAALGDDACRFVHVSTDVVHDGMAGPYADDAPVSPRGAYGVSKAEAEAVVAERLASAVIVRTSLIYGLERIDRATAGFAEQLRRGERLQLFADAIRQPAELSALADSLVTLALDRRDVSGTLNVAGDEPIDRATFGRLLLDWWGITTGPPADPALDRDPVRDRVDDLVDDVAAAEVAPDVPLDLRLRLERAHALGLPTPGVQQVLRRAREASTGARSSGRGAAFSGRPGAGPPSRPPTDRGR